MYKIVRKETLAPQIHVIEIEAPMVTRHAGSGQFVILRVDEHGERIPLTILDIDKKKGTVSLMFQEVGKSTIKLAKLEVGDSIMNFIGPLGNPFQIKKYGTVVLVAGGLGLPAIYDVLKPLKEAGNKVIMIYGARTKDLIFMEGKLKEAADELLVATDDGSYGRKGFVTDVLKEVIEREKVDLVFTVGPLIMMKFVCKLTKEHEVRTMVDLNPIMIDGTGMCGGCRVRIGGELKLVCVDGTSFDGHKVDWDQIMTKTKMYTDEEKEAVVEYERRCPGHA